VTVKFCEDLFQVRSCYAEVIVFCGTESYVLCECAAEWWPRRVEGAYSRYFGRLIGRKT